ncbi:MAG: hypothetical protein IKS34_00370, partial [Clostridia bacterium]|nr:hypothetical protein [Clostridia bacterium]
PDHSTTLSAAFQPKKRYFPQIFFVCRPEKGVFFPKNGLPETEDCDRRRKEKSGFSAGFKIFVLSSPQKECPEEKR